MIYNVEMEKVKNVPLGIKLSTKEEVRMNGGSFFVTKISRRSVYLGSLGQEIQVGDEILQVLY